MSISRMSFSPSSSPYWLSSDTIPTASASCCNRSKSVMSISISSASSSLRGFRPRCASSDCLARDNWCALALTNLGTQSILRSSSKIEPRMRGEQYVSNFTPLPGSNASMASINPKVPELIRSSSSTLPGSLVCRRSAVYRTR